MKMNKNIPALLLGATLAFAPALTFAAPLSQDSSQSSGAKQDMKDAGHETKSAAKDAANGTKKGTKKAYNATKSGTKKAWHKTKSTTKGAVDGAKEGAKEPQ